MPATGSNPGALALVQCGLHGKPGFDTGTDLAFQGLENCSVNMFLNCVKVTVHTSYISQLKYPFKESIISLY